MFMWSEFDGLDLSFVYRNLVSNVLCSRLEMIRAESRFLINNGPCFLACLPNQVCVFPNGQAVLDYYNMSSFVMSSQFL